MQNSCSNGQSELPGLRIKEQYNILYHISIAYNFRKKKGRSDRPPFRATVATTAVASFYI